MDENTQVNSENTAESAMPEDWSGLEVEESPEKGSEEEPKPAEKDENTEPKPDEADQQKQEEDKTGTNKVEPEQPKQTDQFTLKHLGETKVVSKDEAIKLAQQGMDYDRVKQQNGELTAKQSEIDALVKELGFTTVNQLVDSAKIDKLIRSGVDETVATERVKLERKERELAAREAAIEAEKTAKETETQAAERLKAKQNDDFVEFASTYGALKPEEIPKEVWAEYDKGNCTLVQAYMKHENAALKAQLETLKQTAENKSRSTGSRNTDGKASKADAEDAMWYETDHKPKYTGR